MSQRSERQLSMRRGSVFDRRLVDDSNEVHGRRALTRAQLCSETCCNRDLL